MVTPRKYMKNLTEHMRQDKRAFAIYSILRILVIVVLVLNIIGRNFESAFICVISLLLFLVPSVFETRLHIEIPTIFQIIIYLFIFAAEILGEINHYYVRIAGWDTMLHTLNGFLCAVVGFSLVDLLNRKSVGMKLSPAYLAIVAFCFSMTIGVLWEFGEFSMDMFFHYDAQKDFIVNNFASVTLDPTNSQIPIQVNDITLTLIETASGETVIIEGGYLDIGIIDTMKDLFVNLIGAVVFSVFGFLYVRNRDQGKKQKFVEGLLIRRSDAEPSSEVVERELHSVASDNEISPDQTSNNN